MSDEIKAILIQNGKPTPGNPIEIKRLLVNKEAEDYITNLQEENEKLKELCDKYEEEHNNEFKIWKDERQQLLDYKSRCEKATEYIIENSEMYDEDLYTSVGFELRDLLNILGGDKE